MPSFRIKIKKDNIYIFNKVIDSFPSKEFAENWAKSIKIAHNADSFYVIPVVVPKTEQIKR
ncbi:MAG TPA: hypothetical protein PLP33_14740 [Leptospiraceae bacterium]|nr:hypothetical protein [Leptospiraceae bacterium]